MTERCEDLDAYVDGELSVGERAGFEAHLASCEPCGKELPRRLAVMAAIDDAVATASMPGAPRLTVLAGGERTERAEHQRPAPVAPRLGGRRRPLWVAAAAAVVAAAGALVLLWPRQGEPPAVAALDVQLAPGRGLVPRLSYPGADRYRPLDAMRGAQVRENISTQRMAEFETARNWHGVAVAALLAGERERSARFFAQSAPGPDVASDRAALELVDGSPAALERALGHVDRALAAAPDHPGARWNRALVLAGLHLPLAAARDFDQIVALGEPGWSDEARTRAAALRAEVQGRRTRWAQATEAGQRLLEHGAPVPDEMVATVPGYMTAIFYDAVRAAPSAERVLALLPLARRLDDSYRTDRLTSYVKRAATSDFRIRKPLADGYRELIVNGGLPDARLGAFVTRLEQTRSDDIWMGTLVWTGGIAHRLDDFRRRAVASGDPWFVLIAETEAARAELAAGKLAAAERRLRDARAAAQRERLGYRALLLQSQLATLHDGSQQLSQVAEDRKIELREAVAAGEWPREMNVLGQLAAVNQDRYASGLAVAYLTEMLERSDSQAARPDQPQDRHDCARRQYAHDSLASIAIAGFDQARAEAELARSPTCEHRLAIARQQAVWLRLRKPLIQAELYRLNQRAELARRARDGVIALRADPGLTMPERAFLAYIDGLLLVDGERSAARRALREAITLAGTEPDNLNLNLKSRAYSFALLAVDAGRASEFAAVIAILAETLAVAKPDRCAVAIAMHGNRSIVAFSDARGDTGGHYAETRGLRNPDVATLVPPSIVDRLRACDRVRVLARAPLLGTGRLLPPDIAWSYLLAGVTRAPAGQRRLVIANPETPPELHLPALNQHLEAAQAGTVELRGSDATPTRVLQAMRDASVIEFHTHGILANDVSEASYLVLSPEPDRQYALTASDVARARLEASPLVILGACHAATSSRSLEGGIGLAEAFLRAGASAVVASPDAVPDIAAGEFFAAVRTRVMNGDDPAIAVRDERVRRLARSPDGSWVSGVVLFE